VTESGPAAFEFALALSPAIRAMASALFGRRALDRFATLRGTGTAN
jgi:hypothetical protein